MAEAILRQIAGPRFEPLSAGALPAGFIHPLAAAALQSLHIPLGGQESKSWEVYKDTSVAAVITLCDAAAAEICPQWPGNPTLAHWPMPDPVMLPGTEDERLGFAIQVAKRLLLKIEQLTAIDWRASGDIIAKRLQILGEI